MRKVFLILAISFVILNSSIVIVEAQLQGQAKIDSLMNELPKAKPDTNKVKLLASISYVNREINPDEGLKYGEQGLELTNKLNWKNGKALCLNAIGLNYYIGKSEISKAYDLINSALNISIELGNKSEIAKNLNCLGNIYIDKSDFPKAHESSEKALQIYEDLGDELGMSFVLSTIGLIYQEQFNIAKSTEYLNKALKLNTKIGNKSGIANNLCLIGINYSDQSNYPLALEYYHKAIHINKELGRKKNISNVLNNIGNIYLNLSEYSKAFEYYTNSIKIDEELGDRKGAAGTLANIGGIYYFQGNYKKALEKFQTALTINEDLNDTLGIAQQLGNVGLIYMKQSDFQKALENFSKAQKIYERTDNKNGNAIMIGNIGVTYLNLAQDTNKINEHNNLSSLNKSFNLKNSIINLEKSILIFKEINNFKEQITMLDYLSKAHELSGNYKISFEIFKESKLIQDSIFSMDKQKEIANLEAKRENELKDKEILILQTEKKAQQLQSYLLGGGVIVLFGAFGVAFFRFREKKKLSDKLVLQKNEIENQKSIVEEKNEQIYDSIRYASTIQHAILPWDSVLESAFNDIFIIYTPKDIVSGDSYWFQEIDGIKFLAVIDCTGHGIPGSMLTVIASSVLDDAVLSKRLTDTGEILSYMNNKVTEVLNQRLAENQIRDGMELALIAIKDNKIQFSGAGRPLYLKNGTFEIIKTDKRGIAGQTENDEYQFSAIEIEKSENLLLYLTTDGFADQMNEESKKYSTKRFVSLLESISDKPLEEQNQILENEFNSHKGTRSQIDDVTILGIKI